MTFQQWHAGLSLTPRKFLLPAVPRKGEAGARPAAAGVRCCAQAALPAGAVHQVATARMGMSLARQHKTCLVLNHVWRRGAHAVAIQCVTSLRENACANHWREAGNTSKCALLHVLYSKVLHGGAWWSLRERTCKGRPGVYLYLSIQPASKGGPGITKQLQCVVYVQAPCCQGKLAIGCALGCHRAAPAGPPCGPAACFAGRLSGRGAPCLAAAHPSAALQRGQRQTPDPLEGACQGRAGWGAQSSERSLRGRRLRGVGC